MLEIIHTWAPFALSTIMLLSFVLRTVWVAKTTGENPNKLGYDDSIMGLCGRSYMRLTLLIAGLIAVRLFLPDVERYLGPIASLQQDAVTWLGFYTGLVGLLFAIYAQISMATSWRIGIPQDKPGELVSSGPFGISRNPFFLGSFVFYCGMFMMMPNALTAVGVSGIFLTLNVQIREEEKFLSASLGAPYGAYKDKVRRWL